MARIEAAQQQYQVQKDKYERLRSDVTIKLKFLEENKVSEQSSLASFSAFKKEKVCLQVWLDLVSRPSCFSHFQVKVMHKQLLLFHNAISAYFAGNQQQLEQTLKQFNIKLRPPGADKPSWLEEQWEGLRSWSFCSLLLDHLHLLPVENPLLTEDHYRGKHIQIIGWMKIFDERVTWLDKWIAGYYWWMG